MFTVWVIWALLFRYPPEPTKLAVIVCEPPPRLEVVNVATPLPLTADELRVVAPSLNVTVPVAGAPPVVAVTVAVKVTEPLYVEGLLFEARTVVVEASTVWVATAETAGLLFASPAYDAVKLFAPAGRLEVFSVAETPEMAPEPMAPPFENDTLPVGVGEAFDSVAVSVTDCPSPEGLGALVKAIVGA